MSKTEAKEESFDAVLVDDDYRSGKGIIYSTFAASINYLRPFAPQLVPIVVCAFFVPVLFVASGFAGFVVWNGLSAGWEIPLYLQYGDGTAPYAVSLIPSLHPSQRYDISLHLVVPASQSNLALGNFMVNLKLSTTNNKTLVAARRTAVAVAHTSSWTFWSTRVLNIDIPMFSSFVPGAPNLYADVQVGRADNWKTIGDGAGRELSVLSASVRGLVIPHGIRGLAMRFPLLSSLTAAFIFLIMSTLILGIFILPLMLPTDEASNERKYTISTVPFPAERPRRKKRSHFHRTSESTTPSPSSSLIKQKHEIYKMAKMEGLVTNMPPVEDKNAERPLRQRRISTKRESDRDSS